MTTQNHSGTRAAYLRLVRIPNVFTALADVMLGYLFVHHRLAPVANFVWLAFASASLYMAGMVLNDVWDVARDRVARPERPLPSGVISMASARRLGFSFLILGILFGTAAGYWGAVPNVLRWRSGLVALLLASAVVAYDAGLKRTVLGPLAMGSCRGLNVLLGMSCAAAARRDIVFGFDSSALLVAAAIGVYVAGITWFARTESVASSRWQLSAATVVMTTGLASLALLHRVAPRLGFRARISAETWCLLLFAIGFTVVRRCSRAVAKPTPQRVQAAVTSGIWSLIVLDAALSLLVSRPIWAIVILALLAPTIVLAQWFKTT